MRFGRILITGLGLAGLAPLLGLSAINASIATAATADAAKANPGQYNHALVNLLRSVKHLAAADAEPAVIQPIRAPSDRVYSQAILSLDALAITPLRRSLWMVAGAVRIPLPLRRQLRSPLRC